MHLSPLTSEILHLKNGVLQKELSKDILKICVVNRYGKAPVAKGYIKNFGFKKAHL